MIIDSDPINMTSTFMWREKTHSAQKNGRVRMKMVWKDAV